LIYIKGSAGPLRGIKPIRPRVLPRGREGLPSPFIHWMNTGGAAGFIEGKAIELRDGQNLLPEKTRV
jgi:hypothetical protein